MPMTPAEFWDERSDINPTLTPELRAQAEKILGVKLPESLVKVLEYQNGGYSKGFGYPMTQKTSWAEDHVPFDNLAGVVTDPNIRTAFNLLESESLSTEWNLPKKQILLTGNGHWWITLNYRAGDEPSVWWMDTEIEEFLPVAPTFDVFYSGLCPNAEFGL